MDLKGKSDQHNSQETQEFPSLRLNSGVGAFTILHDGSIEHGIVAMLAYENREEMIRQAFLGRLFTHSPELLRFAKAYRLILQSIIDRSKNSIQIQDAEIQAREIDSLFASVYSQE